MGNRRVKAKFEIDATASKKQSRKIWTSFGIAMKLLPFLHPQEVCEY